MNDEIKQTFDLEADAIKKIATALAELTDDRKLTVLQYVFQGIKGDKKASEAVGVEIETGFQGNSPEIKSFLKAKNPKNSYQQLAVLAYFLQKVDGEKGVDKESLKAANIKAGGRSVDNFRVTLNDAKSKYGFFGEGEDGQKILLSYGEDIVDALPDQEKVKELMKSKPRKLKKKTKKEVADSAE